MLVLSRKQGETITIGDNITVRLVRVGRGRVQLGIDAPPEVSITRPGDPVPIKTESAPAPQFQPTVIA